jgi:exodeoxyribonuclease VII small subunit
MTAMISRRLLASAADSGNAPEKFETLLARLEEIVNQMENTELPLEKLLSSYEEGMRLVKTCGDRLVDAEQKVEILARAISVAPEKSAPVAESTPEEKSGGEIRLF